jgi:hypothetical protein
MARSIRILLSHRAANKIAGPYQAGLHYGRAASHHLCQQKVFHEAATSAIRFWTASFPAANEKKARENVVPLETRNKASASNRPEQVGGFPAQTPPYAPMCRHALWGPPASPVSVRRSRSAIAPEWPASVASDSRQVDRPSGGRRPRYLCCPSPAAMLPSGLFAHIDTIRVGWAFGFTHHRVRFDVFPSRLPGFTRRRR